MELERVEEQRRVGRAQLCFCAIEGLRCRLHVSAIGIDRRAPREEEPCVARLRLRARGEVVEPIRLVLFSALVMDSAEITGPTVGLGTQSERAQMRRGFATMCERAIELSELLQQQRAVSKACTEQATIV